MCWRLQLGANETTNILELEHMVPDPHHGTWCTLRMAHAGAYQKLQETNVEESEVKGLQAK